MEFEQSAGGIIIRGNQVAIVSQLDAIKYSFPKGKIEKNETPLEAAYREIYEECGIQKDELVLIEELGSYMRPSGRKPYKNKKITLFLFTTSKDILESQDQDNPTAQWIPINSVTSMLTQENDRKFFLQVLPTILQHSLQNENV